MTHKINTLFKSDKAKGVGIMEQFCGCVTISKHLYRYIPLETIRISVSKAVDACR